MNNADTFQPALEAMLDSWATRRQAAEYLYSLDRAKNVPLLEQRLEAWTKTVGNPEADPEDRATSALTLAFLAAIPSMRYQPKTDATSALTLAFLSEEAKSPVPTLVAALQQELDANGPRLPQIDDFLRNALMLALLDLDPDNENEAVRGVLGPALVKPVLDAIDLTKPYLEEVRNLVEEGREMEAFHTFVRVQSEYKGHDRESYWSKGMGGRDARGNRPNDRAYTPTATRDGITYTLGSGTAFGAVEAIAPEEFKKRVDAIAREYPDAKDWRNPEHPHLYRVPIKKTMPDGTEETVYLGGENFIIDGRDQKVMGWSVVVDSAGYLHIVGGQHNRPDPRYYIPGSWEKFGLSRDGNDESFPNQMYFVSKRPHDITAFECVGQRKNPRNIPTAYLNYMNWVQDANGEQFLYGRIIDTGWQSWGLFHYDVEAQRWSPIGGDSFDVITDALAAHPDWQQYIRHRPRRGHTPRERTSTKSIAWAWQPHFYNYCRDTWGINFDKSNRMHLYMRIRGLAEDGRLLDGRGVYAWSDDLGKTFHRADGSPVKLPLTLNPAPNHNASASTYRHHIYWDTFTQLVRKAGF